MGRQHADNVFGSKLAAKQDIAAMLWPTLGATLLYFIPVILLSTALNAVCGGLDQNILDSLTYEQLLIYLGVYLLAQLLIVKPLYYGLTQFYALRRAGARPSVSTVTMCLASARMYGRSICLALTIALFSLLWAVPLVGACGVGVLVYGLIPNGFGYFLCFEIMVFAVVVYACMVLRYHCAYALLTEQPKLGCWRAVRMSAKKFRGHKRELVSLIVSFFLWFLLAALTGGLLMIVLCPYFLLSVYHLFDRVRGVQIKVVPKKAEDT